ncbi:MAG: hypothetical protein OXR05_03170, partial [Gemmatimonadota bacterium]|nr:hypothetical protein [Gemmatimonadota bacterium]
TSTGASGKQFRDVLPFWQNPAIPAGKAASLAVFKLLSPNDFCHFGRFLVARILPQREAGPKGLKQHHTYSTKGVARCH